MPAASRLPCYSHVRARCWDRGLGTLLVIVFSDPMVDVMSNVGTRLEVPPFYVAFCLAPLASNASELIASLAYAGKKSRKTITVALAAIGAVAWWEIRSAMRWSVYLRRTISRMLNSCSGSR